MSQGGDVSCLCFCKPVWPGDTPEVWSHQECRESHVPGSSSVLSLGCELVAMLAVSLRKGPAQGQRRLQSCPAGSLAGAKGSGPMSGSGGVHWGAEHVQGADEKNTLTQ